MIMWLTGSHPYAFSWLSWVFSVLANLPTIFVYLAKEEWQGIQGQLDSSINLSSYDVDDKAKTNG
jgi:hypothetical protein